jgi:hypothetical protein
VTNICRASYQHPFATSTLPYAETLHYRHSAPASYSPRQYYPQQYGISARYHGYAGAQPWTTQQQYAWQGHHTSAPQPSQPQNAYRGGRQKNKGGGTTGPNFGYWKGSYPPEPTLEEAPVRDNYRPAYTDSSSRQENVCAGVHASRQENVDAAVHGYLRRPLVAGILGPPGKSVRRWRGTSPLSSYLPQLRQDATENPDVHTNSALHSPVRETVLSAPVRSLAALSSVETKPTFTTLQSREAVDSENIGQGMYHKLEN